MPSPISNIPTAQTALNNKANPSPFMSSSTAFPFLSQQGGSSYGQATGGMSVPTPAGVRATYAPQGPAASILPSTPLKKTTTNNIDGSSTISEYHAPPTAPTVSSPVSPAPATPSAFQVAIPTLTGTNYGAALQNQENQQSYTVNSNDQMVSPQGSANASPTFGGIVGGLASTSQNGSSNATQATTGLLNAPNQNTAIGQNAADIAKEYGQEIADVGQQGAKFEAGQLTGFGTSPVASGNAAITAQTTAAQQNALATGENAALLGTGQELTAQNQGQQGLTSAGNIANTQQSNVQSGLGAAGNLALPSATGAGQTTYNPLTNSFAGGSTGTDPTQPPSGYTQAQWNTIVGNVLNGVPNAISGLPTVLQAQAQAAAQVQDPNFNINTALGSATGQQAVGAAGGQAGAQNVITSSTAAGAVSSAQTQQIASYQSAQQQGQNLISQAKDLISTFGLNPSELNAANGAIQKIAENTSSPQYQELSNYLNDIAARYAQILTPPGGSATDSTRAIAASMLNSTAQGTSLQQVMDSLDQQASAVIAGVRTQTPTSPATNAGTTTASPTGSGGGWASLGD